MSEVQSPETAAVEEVAVIAAPKVEPTIGANGAPLPWILFMDRFSLGKLSPTEKWRGAVLIADFVNEQLARPLAEVSRDEKKLLATSLEARLQAYGCFDGFEAMAEGKLRTNDKRFFDRRYKVLRPAGVR